MNDKYSTTEGKTSEKLSDEGAQLRAFFQIQSLLLRRNAGQKALPAQMCIRDRFGIRMRVLYDGLALNQVRWGTKQP